MLARPHLQLLLVPVHGLPGSLPARLPAYLFALVVQRRARRARFHAPLPCLVCLVRPPPRQALPSAHRACCAVFLVCMLPLQPSVLPAHPCVCARFSESCAPCAPCCGLRASPATQLPVVLPTALHACLRCPAHASCTPLSIRSTCPHLMRTLPRVRAPVVCACAHLTLSVVSAPTSCVHPPPVLAPPCPTFWMQS